MLQSQLQGWIPTNYERGIRKGDFELLFDDYGFSFRPWYEMKDDHKSFKITHIKNAKGDTEERFKPHDISIMDAKDQGLLEEGPWHIQGHYDLKPALVGPIVRIEATKDTATPTVLSSPNQFEMYFWCKAVETKKVRMVAHVKIDKIVDVEEGQLYRYVLQGVNPAEWCLIGPSPEIDIVSNPISDARKRADRLLSEAELQYAMDANNNKESGLIGQIRELETVPEAEIEELETE
jgi:hypothetical protein